MLVTGGIGLGKTTLLKNLAGTVLNPIPIYIDLTCAYGEGYIFKKILREYCGTIDTKQAEGYRETLIERFQEKNGHNPMYLLLIDGLDNTDRKRNPDLHKDLQTLAECQGVQIVLAAQSMKSLKNHFYFKGIEQFQVYQVLLLEPEKVKNVLFEKKISIKTLNPDFLELLRRPFFLFHFLDLVATDGNAREMHSAYDVFDAMIDQEIRKLATHEGSLDRAEYAFYYLLPALACKLDRVAFSSEELYKALLEAYFDTYWQCEDLDDISTDTIARTKKGLNTEEYRDFTELLKKTVGQEYIEKAYLPAGCLIKDDS